MNRTTHKKVTLILSIVKMACVAIAFLMLLSPVSMTYIDEVRCDGEVISYDDNQFSVNMFELAFDYKDQIFSIQDLYVIFLMICFAAIIAFALLDILLFTKKEKYPKVIKILSILLTLIPLATLMFAIFTHSDCNNAIFIYNYDSNYSYYYDELLVYVESYSVDLNLLLPIILLFFTTGTQVATFITNFKLKPDAVIEEDVPAEESGKIAVPVAEEPVATDAKYEELKNLKELLDSGVITQEDFDKKKAEILNL